MTYEPKQRIQVRRPIAGKVEEIYITRILDPSGDNGDYILCGVPTSRAFFPRYLSGGNLYHNEVAYNEVYIQERWIIGSDAWKACQGSSMFSLVSRVSKRVRDGRSLQDILTHTTTELGELAQEIQIQSGRSYKSPGPDGVVGEAVDLIICALDIIFKSHPEITEQELNYITRAKCEKWEDTAPEEEVEDDE